MQKKAIVEFINKQDDLYFKRAEDFASCLLRMLRSQGQDEGFVVDAYLRLCHQMIIEQIRFKKTGKYSCANVEQAYSRVYSSESEMASYMYGLALSLYLWPNHYGLFDFFIRESRKLSKVRSYLEIGPGHGLFLVEAIKMFEGGTFSAVDISPVSRRLTETVVKHFTDHANLAFLVMDIASHDRELDRFDYVVMCEVLEHLEDPKSVLARLRALLKDDGHLFLTTCANAPAVDHVYLYDSVNHIRREIREAGLMIVSELALPVGDHPEHEWESLKVEVNYAAMAVRN